jgi:hypothetical protein
VGFDFFSHALFESDRFRRKGGREINPLTFRDPARGDGDGVVLLLSSNKCKGQTSGSGCERHADEKTIAMQNLASEPLN